MTEHPILFSGPMVRAILEGRKTQTRRVIKPQTTWGSDVEYCPHGVPGDRLWVRETWCPLERADWSRPGREYNVNYKADATPEGECIRKEMGYQWKPSIFMPRWASRITLEITGVKVERIQELLDHKDIMAEGILPDEGPRCYSCRTRFAELWDSLNAKRGYGWDANPWVWVIEFKRLG